MWNGKNKAITFSFDDGVTQDRRLVEIFNKYGLKATFNINSELLGKEGTLMINGQPIPHNKIDPSEVKTLYEGHEVAVHTLTHPNLTTLEEKEIIYQVEKDRENLSALCGSTAIVIGSEGGFSRAEEELAAGCGFASVTLGKRILRAETAAVALTSVVMFSLGELGDSKGAGAQ